MKYVIRDRIAGNAIEKFNTYQEALDMLNKYEAGDKEEDIYEPDFYEIVEEDICSLKKLRQINGYTQKQLSETTNIPFRTIQDLEADKVMHISTTRADYLFRLAKVLDVSMEELCGCKVYEIYGILPYQEDTLSIVFTKDDAIASAHYHMNHGWKRDELEIRYDITDGGYNILKF